MPAPATVTVHLDEPTAPVSRFLHGQFIEHMGTCVNGGLWVGERSPIPNVHGLRRDVLDVLRTLRVPVVRWPGGCFADQYHWEDGIGPREHRPMRVTNRWGPDEIEPNGFGTHEFIAWCRALGAEPWLGGNVATGTARELRDWCEYCNFAGDTTRTRQRAANGHPAPMDVRFWGIGNESWDCGGKFRPEVYADHYRQFESNFPRFAGQDPFLIACGPDGTIPRENAAWTREFFGSLDQWRRPRLHGWDAHFYTWNNAAQHGTDTVFTAADSYEMLWHGTRIEEVILQQCALLDEFSPATRLILGEWGHWHPQRPDAPLTWQQNTLRDALGAALTLDTFHRHADKLWMANFAQTVNVLGSLILTEPDDGSRMLRTPTFHVFDLYRDHQDGTGVRVTFHAPDLTLPPGATAEGRADRRLPGLSGSATVRDGRLTLSVVNPHASEPVETDLHLHGGSPGAAVNWTGRVLTASELNAHNTFDAPDTLLPRAVPVRPDGRHVFPAASVTVLQTAVHSSPS